MVRYNLFDGLRGLLAAWVVAQHILQFSGFRGGEYGPIVRLLTSGGIAVQVFVILSGFVITHLLIETRPAYLPYITRRFFRLFPVYLLCLALGLLTFQLPVEIADMLPTQDWGTFPKLVEISNATQANFSVHLALHLPMLHGIAPDEILPSSSVGFLPPAWSISLEWQFYLLAPLLLYLAMKNAVTRAVLAVVIVLFIQLSPKLGTWFPGGFLGQHLHLFTIGGLSVVLTKTYGDDEKRRVGAAILAMAIVFLLAPGLGSKLPYLSYVIWLAVLGVALINSANRNSPAGFALWLLQSKPILWLGKVSFSTYLIHWPIMLVCQYQLLRYLEISQPGTMLALLVCTSLPLVYIASWLSYRTLEAPGIRAGRFLASMLHGPRRTLHMLN